MNIKMIGTRKFTTWILKFSQTFRDPCLTRCFRVNKIVGVFQKQLHALYAVSEKLVIKIVKMVVVSFNCHYCLDMENAYLVKIDKCNEWNRFTKKGQHFATKHFSILMAVVNRSVGYCKHHVKLKSKKPDVFKLVLSSATRIDILFQNILFMTLLFNRVIALYCRENRKVKFDSCVCMLFAYLANKRDSMKTVVQVHKVAIYQSEAGV